MNNTNIKLTNKFIAFVDTNKKNEELIKSLPNFDLNNFSKINDSFNYLIKANKQIEEITKPLTNINNDFNKKLKNITAPFEKFSVLNEFEKLNEFFKSYEEAIKLIEKFNEEQLKEMKHTQDNRVEVFKFTYKTTNQLIEIYNNLTDTQKEQMKSEVCNAINLVKNNVPIKINDILNLINSKIDVDLINSIELYIFVLKTAKSFI